jgi:hypothetical protein
MLLINSTGLISIMFLAFWLFGMPFIYPRRIEKYLTDRVTKRHFYIFWNFYLSFAAAGVILLFSEQYSRGAFILISLLAGAGIMRFMAFSSFDIVLDILYDNRKIIAFYLFVAAVLLTGIINFYGSNPTLGIILCWTVFINLSTTALGLILSDKQTYIRNVKEQEAENRNKEIDIDNWDVFSFFDFFSKEVNNDTESLLEGINSVLGHLTTDIYANLIPEEERPNDIEQLVPVITKHILTKDSGIPEKEAHIIKILLDYKKELSRWTETSKNLIKKARPITETDKKKQSSSKKKVQKISKEIKKEIKGNKSKARSINPDNKPGHSTPPDNKKHS